MTKEILQNRFGINPKLFSKYADDDTNDDSHDGNGTGNAHAGMEIPTPHVGKPVKPADAVLTKILNSISPGFDLSENLMEQGLTSFNAMQIWNAFSTYCCFVSWSFL